jgi:hypothetical protein
MYLLARTKNKEVIRFRSLTEEEIQILKVISSIGSTQFQKNNNYY